MALSYLVSVTGDCLNISAGALYVEPIGGTSPYTVDWTVPALGTDSSVTSSTRNGLAFGTYQLNITDSSIPNNQLSTLLTVSSGVCLDISATNTSCDLSNGSVLAIATTSTNYVEYYLYSLTNGYITSASTITGYNSFTSLSADTYYVDAYDAGGCSGASSTAVVANSNTFDYGLFVVNNSRCSGPAGKIYVTGQTGTPPYTYLWNTSETTNSISGLSAGNYSVTVTDTYGCQITKSTIVEDVLPPGILTILPVQPSCFATDGEITVYVSGGTAPFFYVLSNGDSKIDFSSNVTFTGLSNGTYNVTITDSALCTATGTITLSTPNSFNLQGITSASATCGLSNGYISASVFGGIPPYTYVLNNNSGTTITSGTSSTNVNFTSLSSGNYHLTISNSSDCVYETDIVISNNSPFIVTTQTTDTTCGLNNGVIEINVNTGGTYTYEIPGKIITTSSTAQTFNNLSSGIYSVSVTNSDGCRQTTQVIIKSSDSVQFSLIDTGCGNTGKEGTITAVITNGTPPFILNWSSNVGSQDGIFVTGLTAGAYSLTVTDSNDCSLTKNTQIVCGSVNTSYQIFNICNDIFTERPGTKTGFAQMLNQGYQDLTSGETNCKLTLAQFNLILNVGSSAFTSNFFATTLLSQYPTDQQYVDALNTLLSGVPGIGSIVINSNTNSISLNTDCDRTLSADTVSVNIRIDYNICCYQVPTPTPTPSITPTLTPTPTVTPTITVTPSVNYQTYSVNQCCNVSISGFINLPVTYSTNDIILATDGQCYRVVNDAIGTPTLTWSGLFYNDCTECVTANPCLQSFKMFANDLRGVYLHLINSTSGYTMNWGDGTYTNYNAGSNYGGQHIYSGATYSGDITLLSYDLSSVKTIYTDVKIGTGGTNPSLLITGSELSKLSGLTLLSNVQSIFTGYTSELPRTMQTFYSLKGKLKGDIDNFPDTLKSLTLGGYETNDISGDTKNFPSGMTYIYINGGTNTINGDIKDIPSGLTFFGIWGNNTISGNTANIHSGITTFYLYGLNTLVGDISNVPISASTFIAYGHNSLSGNVLSLSAHTLLRTLSVANREFSPTGNTIDGDINDVPKKLDYLELRGFNTIYGNIVNMPTGSTIGGTSQYFNLRGLNTVSGQSSDISIHVSDFFLGGSNTLSGNTSNFPSNIKVLTVGGLNTITGDIANLPPNAWYIDFTGTHTIKDYTAGRTWAPNMNYLNIVPSLSATNYFTTTEIDNLMIDLTGTTWSYSTRFGYPGITLVGTASTISQAARNKLSGSTPTGYGVNLRLI